MMVDDATNLSSCVVCLISDCGPRREVGVMVRVVKSLVETVFCEGEVYRK